MKYNRRIIYLVGTIFSLPIALMSYMNSSFISSFVSEKLVGMVYAGGSIASIIALLIAPKIFRKIGGYKFLLWVIALDAISILLFAFSYNAWSTSLLFICGFMFNTLILFSLDELLKILSRASSTGRTRGIYITLCSCAWIVAQLALGTILGESSFRFIYLTSFVMMVLFFFISYFHLGNIPDPEYDRTDTRKYLGEFLKNKNLLHAYIINLLLQFFFCWMVIYTPIYLSLHLGFPWKDIGVIFAIMLLPFVIIPFQLGKYADKIGERKMLILGFIITSLATLSIFFLNTHNIWLWALVLFMTRVGAASLEVMSDAYFFKHIRPENEEFIGVYRSAAPIAYIVGPLLAFTVFSFVPSFNYIFLILGTVMLYGVYLSSTIKKNDI